ncbi:MAG: ferritin [Acidobacteriota bacterium]|jgi:ferritin
MPKLSKKMVKELNAQLGRELSAANQYLAMAIHLDDKSLNELAAFFYAQSEEERGHAMKFLHYLLQANEMPVVPEVPKPVATFKSIEQIAEMSLEQEQEVTRCIHHLVDLALAEKDHTTNHFLQWFVEEQLEEEATISELLDVIRQSENLLLVEQYVFRQKPGEGGGE